MNSRNDRSKSGSGEIHRANPHDAAVDAVAAAQQDQVKADHDALQESARRVDASVSEDVRNTPIQAAHRAGSDGDLGKNVAATDAAAVAKQEQVKADHDALEESARRVEASVTSDVRNRPIQPAGESLNASDDDEAASRNADQARENADAARASARRVEESAPGNRNRSGR